MMPPPAMGLHAASDAYARPAPWRRILALVLIAALHVGFFYLLQDGLLHQIQTARPLEIVTAILFPPAPAETVPAPAMVKPPRDVTPTVRPVVKPRNVVPKAAPAAPAAPARVPVAAVPAASAEPAPAVSSAPAAIPAAPPVPAQPKTITSGVQYLQPPQPDYPAQSKRLGEEGRVVLRALINQQGMVERVELQKSSGFPRLDDAAREAVQRARFRPHLEDGKPVTVFAIVPISFRLDQ